MLLKVPTHDARARGATLRHLLPTGFDLAFQRSLLDFGGVHFLRYILAGLVPLGSLINGFVA